MSETHEEWLKHHMEEDASLPSGLMVAITNDVKDYFTMAMSTNVSLNWFALDRQEDVTGISGTGIIAFALVLEHGVLVFWDTGFQTMSWYPDMETVLNIHGHDGRTVPARIVAIERPMTLLHHRIPDVIDTIGDLCVSLVEIAGSTSAETADAS